MSPDVFYNVRLIICSANSFWVSWMDNNSASTEFKQLIARGKEQGYLTIEEINDLIPPDIISGDQLSVFIQTFIDMGINVCETPPDPD